MKTAIFASILLISCVTTKPFNDEIPEEFHRHVDTYMNITGNTEIKSIMRFGETGEEEVGYCHFGYFINEIVINEHKWHLLHELEKEFLILHELGHCELYYDHSIGIMEPSIIPHNLYGPYREVYLFQYKNGLPKMEVGLFGIPSAHQCLDH